MEYDKHIQNIMMFSDKFNEEKDYWLNQLSGDLELSGFEGKYNEDIIQGYKKESVSTKLPKEVLNKLNDITNKSELGIYIFLVSAVQFVLYKYTANEDVILGAPILKTRVDLKGINKFIALRTKINNELTFKEFLMSVKQTISEANKFCSFPFNKIAEELKISYSDESIFKTVVALENIHGKDYLENTKPQANFLFRYEEEVIECNLEFNSLALKKEIAEQILTHISNFLMQIVTNPHLLLKEIDIISVEEKKYILSKSKGNPLSCPHEKVVHKPFEKRAYNNPHGIAVECGDETITYEELNSRANQVGRILREKCVGRDSKVAVMTKKTIDMIVAILGVLKAGGAYIPVDFKLPKERIEYILQDSKAAILLSDKKINNDFNFEGKTINIYDKSVINMDISNMESINNSTDLAYIIYTSGSTGKPKGVMVEHRSLINFLYSIKSFFNEEIYEGEKYLSLTNISFDVSVCEIFLPLVFGGTLVLFDNERVIDIPYLAETIIDKAINFTYIPPLLLKELSEKLQKSDKKIYLNKLLVGVEPIKDYILEEYIKLNKNIQIVNGYGPTEATICATFYKYTSERASSEIVPIGTPLSNSKVYILDKDNKIAPIGVSGELYIAGDGLARGYLNNDELTKEKFIKNPIIEGEKIYKTGDIAKWLPDGNIQFIGRNDNQVKIRGFRIELGEVENQLSMYDGIKEAVVLAKDESNGSKYLCAYIVCKSEVEINDIRRFLSTKLPVYMIPSYFIRLERIPLNSSGKIDRKALEQIELSVEKEADYEKPANEVEERLLVIWKSILNIDEMGVDDNLFQMGGHSLKVITLTSKISKEFGVDIPISEIFNKPTIRELAQFVDRSEKRIHQDINPVEEREYYPLSSAEKRLFILNEIEGASITYNIPLVMEVEGNISRDAFDKAIKALINRHESLRTSFKLVDGEPVQVVNKGIEPEIIYANAKEEEVEKIINEFIRPFDLSKAPLFRAGLITLSEERHIFIIDMHHIVSDGFSTTILLREFNTLYEGEKLSDLKIQYKDYAVWQNNLKNSQYMKKQEEYWKDIFKDEIPVLELQTDYTRPQVQSFEGDIVEFNIEKELFEEVKKLAVESGATLFMMFMAVYNILLYKHTGQEDIVIGTPISGRNYEDIKDVVGMFVNTLAMRNYPKKDKPFDIFLKDVVSNCLNAYENQDFQFEELVSILNIVNSTGRNPIFDTMFVMDNSNEEIEEDRALKLKPCKFTFKVAKFDMTFGIYIGTHIRCNIEYCTKIFKKETVENYGRRFVEILKQVTANPKVKICEIDILTSEEKNKLIYEFNNTYIDYPREKTIQELFEAQIEKTPDNIAVIFEDKKLTYRELNEKSNSLAWVLRNKGVKADSIVGIMVERSLEMMIGIMAILKAGGAYLPIDPKYPKDRIEYILKDSGTEILLSKSDFIEGIDFEKIVIDLFKDDIYAENCSNLYKINCSNSLAYVIYTSGTTGNPKGVMIEHKALVNRLIWMQNKYPLNERNTILQKTTYTFDVSVWELLWWSLVGAKVCMLSPNDEKDPVKIIEAIDKYSITTMHFSPSMLDVFLYSLEEGKKESSLNTLIQVFSSGEALKPKQVLKFYKEFGDSKKLINLYGPTEAAIDVTYFETTSNSDVNAIPIGKPISNINLYILDKNRKLQPIGVPGELYISGDGLSRGYLNKPELTLEKFVHNSFVPSAKMYRTGDLAIWLPDGNVEFLGRIDNQVKIRGFRIELGEIENKLLQHEDVKESVALVVEGKDEDKYICAYIVSEKEIGELNLNDYLKESLPEYMIPSYIVKVDKIPTTLNGKLDRRALPEPNLEERLTSYEAPRNAIEESLVRIWRQVLGIDRIGINDNFFELGGHSLKAVRVVSLIQKEFGVKLYLKEIYNFSNILSLSKAIKGSKNHVSVYSEIVPLPKQEYYELSYAQKRLWILNQLDPNSPAYNMSECFTLLEKVNGDIIQRVFDTLIQRHEAFRTRFEEKDGVVVQIIDGNANFDIDKQDLSMISQEEKDVKRKRVCKEVATKLFNLEVGPLIYVKLVKLSDKEYDLIYCMHHIISDGWSLEVLKNEFFLLYESYKKGKKCDLATLKIQYKDFASWQNKLIENKEVSQPAKAFWHKQLGGEVPILKLPVDYPTTGLSNKESGAYRIVLTENKKDKLKELAQEYGTSLFVVMLTTFKFFLFDLAKQRDILIGTATFGREHADLQNVIGYFINTTILRNEINEEESFADLLKRINENTLNALEYQSYPLELIVEELKIKYPKISAFFNMLNMGESTEEYIDDFNFYHINKVQDIKFELVWYVIEYANGIEIMCTYLLGLFEPLTIEYMMQRYILLLDEILTEPNKLLKEYIIGRKKRKL